MPLITAIEKQPRRQRADVFLDGEFALSLRLDVITIARLEVGLELPPERRAEIEAEDQRLGAVEAALKLLAMGPRSEHDLRDRLKNRRRFVPQAVEHAVQRMRELGYLNDASFARYYVEARQASPRSKRALAFELQRKGVDKRHVETALEAHSDAEAAYDAAQRRLRALRDADRQTFERRLGSFLASRGFGYGIARATVARCWQELHASDDSTGDAAGFNPRYRKPLTGRPELALGMATDYALYLESGPKRRKTMVHVLDLLGCVAVDPTTEEAIESTPEAIRAYLRFRRRCGEDVDPDAPFNIHVEEHVTQGMWLGNGSPYLMYGPDYRPVSADEIVTFTGRFHEMREMLATWAAEQTAESLDADTRAGRKNRAILLHVLVAGGNYASPLVGGIPGNSRTVTATERGDLSLADGLRQSEALISDALLASTAEQRSEVVTRGQITRSLRKAIRRTLEHDWEHIAELSRRPGGPAI